MTQDQPNWQKRLEELEKEVNQTLETSPIRLNNAQNSLEKGFYRLQTGYQGLPTPAKVVVVVVGGLVLLSLLNTVLKLVASLISLGILAIIFYGLYKFIIKSPSSED